jgi:cell division protein FtsA
VGAKNITNDIAIGMRMSLQSAEKIKLYLSRTQDEVSTPQGVKASEVARLRKEHDTINLDKLGIKEEPATASRKALIEGIIRPRLNEIFTLVASELKNNDLINVVPAGLVVTGGGAETVSLLEAARRTLSLPARIGLPKGLSGLVDELASPAYGTATGLIHYALKQGGISASSPGPRKLVNPFKQLPVKGIYQKVLEMLKNLLP